MKERTDWTDREAKREKEVGNAKSYRTCDRCCEGKTKLLTTFGF